MFLRNETDHVFVFYGKTVAKGEYIKVSDATLEQLTRQGDIANGTFTCHEADPTAPVEAKKPAPPKRTRSRKKAKSS